MHKTVRVQYPLVFLIDALNLLTKAKTWNWISTGLCDKVLKNIDVMKIHIGKGVLDYFIEKIEPYINGKMYLFEKP